MRHELETLNSHDDIAKVLKKVQLFKRLTNQERLRIAKALERKPWKKNDYIITQGDDGDEFFIIIKGNVGVMINKDDSDEPFQVGGLSSGDYVGARALLRNEPRNASIVVQSELVVTLSMSRQMFNDLFGEDKIKVRFGRRRAVRLIARAPTIPGGAPKAVEYKEKSQKIRKLITRAILNNPLFNKIPDKNIHDLIRVMWPRKVAAGTFVIMQGSQGDNFYVVEEGILNVLVQDELGKGREGIVNTIVKEESFGEFALLYNMPRTATVRARTDCKLWVCDKHRFKKHLITLPEKKVGEYEKFMKQNVTLLDPLSNRERRSIAGVVDEMHFEAEDVISDTCEIFYMVRSGCGIVYRVEGEVNDISNSNPEQLEEVTAVGPGHVFGMYKPRGEMSQLMVHVKGDSMCCLTIDGQTFNELIAPVLGLVEGLDVDTITTQGGEARRTVTQNCIPMEELDILRQLGVGQYGEVKLVKKKGEGDKVFALKQISKGFLKEHDVIEQIINEKNSMLLLDTPFCIKLYSTMQDMQMCYFLLELCSGGELHKLMQNRGPLPEDLVSFYAANIVLALEHIHDRGIVYRDLKPENILISESGYLKMVDFGFCKIIGNRKTNTICGTPDYMSPEVIKGEGHDYGTDWWTLGVIIFEMLTGMTPFHDVSRARSFKKILMVLYKFPKGHFSREAKSIVKGFLKLEPNHRLGRTRSGVDKIKQQPFFFSVKWDEVYDQTVTPPGYRPPSKKPSKPRKEDEDIPFVLYESDGEGRFDEF